MYIDSNNTLYICDHDNNRIQKWVQGATSDTTVAGSSSGTNGASSILLDQPMDLTFDQNGYMYVVDSNNNRIQRFAPNSTNGTTVAGTGSNTAALTDLRQPSAMVFDNNSNMYIIDMRNQRVMKWAANATNGSISISNNNLDNSYSILLVPGPSNQLYISDQSEHGVCLWTLGSANPNNILTTVNDTSQLSLNNNVQGITLDPYGNLYVADRDNNRVVMYCPNSTMGIVVAQDPSGGNSLQHPMGIAFDSNLDMYVVIKDQA